MFYKLPSIEGIQLTVSLALSLQVHERLDDEESE